MLRNKEFQKFAILFLLITIVTVTLGFAINVMTGILATAFGTVFFMFTKNRYESIAHISEQIDIVLHNADHLYIAESEEGELSILQSEEYLADSLADIAHQLRTPLTSVTLILSLLENNPDEKERKDLIRETEELLVRMDWLITSLLKLSRLDAGIVVFQKEEIAVNNLISAALHQFLIPMELHNITLQINVPKGTKIWGDLN